MGIDCVYTKLLLKSKGKSSYDAIDLTNETDGGHVPLKTELNKSSTFEDAKHLLKSKDLSMAANIPDFFISTLIKQENLHHGDGNNGHRNKVLSSRKNVHLYTGGLGSSSLGPPYVICQSIR